MYFAAILAGGSGTRMGNPEKPKQFLFLGDKPILVHTLEKFCASGRFDSILVLCPASWVQQTRDIIEKYCPQYASTVAICAGGATRNDTIKNAIIYLESNCSATGSDIIVTHDAVRPFVSLRIIEENIEIAEKYGACDTVVPATDTIVESLDGEVVSQIPNRHILYQGQTPQSFKIGSLKEMFDSLTAEENVILTDACKAFTLRGRQVALVRGDSSNIKITYPQDLRVALAMLEA